MPSVAGSPDPVASARGTRPPTDWSQVGRTLGVSAAGLAIVIALMFTAYTAAFAKPKPHDIPVAVVGPPTAVARLDASPALAARRAPSRQAAERLVRDRDVYGVLDVSRPERVGLSTAEGASRSVAQALTTIATASAQQDGARLTAAELAPTSPNDPNGTVEFYCVVFLAVGAALGSSVLARVHGPVEARIHFAERFALLMGYSALLAGAFVLMGDAVFGALTGHAGWLFLALWGYTAAIAVAAAGASELFGAVAGVVLTLLFTLLGNTSAGGAVGQPLLNDFFAAMHPLFPHGGGLSIIRGVQYFDGAGIGSGILCLALWAVGGLTLLRLAALQKTRAANGTARSAVLSAASARNL